MCNNNRGNWWLQEVWIPKLGGEEGGWWRLMVPIQVKISCLRIIKIVLSVILMSCQA